jgi:hypothetical protein
VVVAVTPVNRPREILALLVPADPNRPVRSLLLPVSSRAFSDAIGGGLLDDSLTATAPDSQAVAFYLDELRVERNLPFNPRAAVLAGRLGLYDPGVFPTLRGDLLVTGLTADGSDVDVPHRVLTVLADGPAGP